MLDDSDAQAALGERGGAVLAGRAAAEPGRDEALEARRYRPLLKQPPWDDVTSRGRYLQASVNFGIKVGSAEPGSVQGLILSVYDLDETRAELIARGAEVSEVFHDQGGVFVHAGTEGRLAGPDPEGRSYSSWASFTDPDGNGWLLQEIKTRLPGRWGVQEETMMAL